MIEKIKKLNKVNYIIDSNIQLQITSNKKVIKEYITKIHLHHNSIDTIDPIPIKDIAVFKPMRNTIFWLIVYQEHIVGFINIIYRRQAVNNLLEVQRLYIDEEMRNRGIGEKVIQKINSLAKNEGYSGLCLKVYCDNPAVYFYERNGFETYYRYMVLKKK